MKIEPIVTEKELTQAKENSKLLNKKFFDTNLETNFVFTAKANNSIIGLIELTPIAKKGILIKNLLCHEQSVAKTLIKEALMYAWELEYNAAFIISNNPVFSALGFDIINTAALNLSFNCSKVFAYPLSYDGLKAFMNKTVVHLN